MNTTALRLTPSASARRTRRRIATPVLAVRSALSAGSRRRADRPGGVDRIATPSQIALRSVTRHEPFR